MLVEKQRELPVLCLQLKILKKPSQNLMVNSIILSMTLTKVHVPSSVVENEDTTGNSIIHDLLTIRHATLATTNLIR